MDKVKSLAYPIMLSLITAIGGYIVSELKEIRQDLKIIKAYINYQKGKIGDDNLITNYRMYAKKEEEITTRNEKKF